MRKDHISTCSTEYSVQMYSTWELEGTAFSNAVITNSSLFCSALLFDEFLPPMSSAQSKKGTNNRGFRPGGATFCVTTMTVGVVDPAKSEVTLAVSHLGAYLLSSSTFGYSSIVTRKNMVSPTPGVTAWCKSAIGTCSTVRSRQRSGT